MGSIDPPKNPIRLTRVLGAGVAGAVIVAGLAADLFLRPSAIAPAPNASNDQDATLEARANQGEASAEELVQLGFQSLQREEPLKAAEFAFQARKANPQLPQPYLLLGSLYATSGQTRKARESFTKAVAVAPSLVEARQALARFEMEQRRPEVALAQLQTAVALDKNNAQTWLMAGQVQRMLKSDGSAPGSFRRALSIDPNLAEAHAALGVIEVDYDQFANAVSPLQKAYDLGDRSPNTLSLLALSLVAGPGTPEAAAQAERLLSEAGHPQLPGAWFAEGLLKDRKGDHAGAQELYKKVLAVGPRNERAQYALAESYRQAGDAEEARKAFDKHHRLSSERQSLKPFEKQISEQGPKPALLRRYAETLLRIGRREEALTQLKLWAQVDPKNPEPKRRLEQLARAAKSSP